MRILKKFFKLHGMDLANEEDDLSKLEFRSHGRVDDEIIDDFQLMLGGLIDHQDYRYEINVGGYLRYGN